MKKTFKRSILLVLSGAGAAFALFTTQNLYAYYGRQSTEAVLSFDALIDIPWNGGLTLNEINPGGSARNKVLKLVHAQILHLDGVFHSDKFAKKWGGPAGCGPWYEPGTYNVDFSDILPQTEAGRLKLKYKFSATIVVQKDPLRRHENQKMEVWLPYAPDRIYDLSVKWNKNQCTDRDDNVRDSYYYYWDPFMKSCNLRKDYPESIQWLQADVHRLANTTATYPEYGDLYKDSDASPELNISMFWGYISHNVKARKPFYRDEGYQAMQSVTQKLLDEGYEQTEEHPHFLIDKNGEINDEEGANVLRKMKKTIRRNGRDMVIQITMLLANTEMEEKDPTFHHFVKPALNTADIFIYDGHSGDGDSLDPDQLHLPQQRKKKYQLFFINGCDSYMNYLQKFLLARGGTDNLDLVISATPTLASASAPNDWTFLKPFAEGQTLSYQFMLNQLEKSNGKHVTFLVGVLGDEKDTWRP